MTVTTATAQTPLSELRPKNIDEALADMRTALNHFHARNDKRAIFLRLYYIMTLEVHAAVHGLNEYADKPVFLDSDWIKRLSGIFAGLFFRSLDTERPCADAWRIAHATSDSAGSTVVQNALCGINAHINYDLAHAIGRNLVEHGDLADPEKLAIRKFDHDQVNNLLVRSLPYIQDVLARDYGPAIGAVDTALGPLDERISDMGLKYYRERVWADAVAYAAALRKDALPEDRNEDAVGPAERVVRSKLNWESQRLAKLLTDGLSWHRLVWVPEKVALLGRRLIGRPPSYARLTLELEGGVKIAERRDRVHPFG